MSLAEDLPALYRAILDGVAQLERVGRRREAGVVRAEATHVYSTRWDEAGYRRLEQIQRRIERLLSGNERAQKERPPGWRPASRPARTPQHDPV